MRPTCITEYDETRTMNLFREEGFEEGFQEGVEEGTLSVLSGLVNDGILSIADAAKRANMSEADFRKKAALA